MTNYRLSPPQLDWKDSGAPESVEFGDVYFDKDSGIEETRFVFLNHNHLTERFIEIEQGSTNHSFTIGETGFGTGLNFLCAWQLWQQTVGDQHDKRLHFISVEKYPLTKAELVKALAIWPELTSLADELIQNYPVICKGLHRIELDNGRVHLSLWFGDAQEGFTAINADIDAWFLDGFAPSKNPDMWNSELFNEIKRLSHKDTTIATFTAAGIVRRGLQAVDFKIEKVKGFGKKREMLVGKLADQPLNLAERATSGAAWFNNRTNPISLNKTFHVLVVGAGLAGCHTAHALANKGIKVTLWDQHNTIANEASGNSQGMLYPKLAAQDTSINRFYLTSYLYANSQLNKLAPELNIWSQSGLEQRPVSRTEAEKFLKLLTAEIYPHEVVGHGPKGSLLLPLSGWVRPQAWCQHLTEHRAINFQGGKTLTSLKQIHDADNQLCWQATANKNEVREFSHVVLCTANDQSVLKEFIELPTKPIRGQVSCLPLKGDLSPSTVLCQEGYVSPALNGLLHFGSSYGIGNHNPNVCIEDHKSNLDKLTHLLPDYPWHSDITECEGRVSFRCTVADYAPIIGPVPDVDPFVSQYDQLKKNAKWKSQQVLPSIPNLYLNVGHGSRGLVSTPLAGEYLSSLITQETSVYERTVEHSIHPARFLVRALKRGQI